MYCKRPQVVHGSPFACGRCLLCRIKKRREWMHRLLLEQSSHEESSFVTLTYDNDSYYSVVDEDGIYRPTLFKPHYQLWLKRLRRKIEPHKLRYYICGEYGDSTQRPHYHVALFGFPPCRRGRTEHRLSYCCDICELLKSTWSYGGVDSGTLTPESAQYIVGYVTKKMTKSDDVRLLGRHPEFGSMSLRPAIGLHAMQSIFEYLISDSGLLYIIENGDVPAVLQCGNKQLPLGKYLRSKLREYMGFYDENGEIGKAPVWSKNDLQEKMRLLREDYIAFTEDSETTLTFVDFIEVRNAQKVRNALKKQSLYGKKDRI